MVTPKNDDGVVFVRSHVQAFQNRADAHVGETHAGQIGLHHSAPVALFSYFVVGGFDVEPALEIGREIGEVGEGGFGQGDLIFIVKVEPFLRDEHRNVWSENPDRHEEGFVVFFFERSSGVFGEVVVDHLFVGLGKGTPVPGAAGPVHLLFGARSAIPAEVDVDRVFQRSGEAVVENFSAGQRAVAVLLEVSGHARDVIETGDALIGGSEIVGAMGGGVDA